MGHWRLGFKQSSLHHATRVSRGHRLHGFGAAPASAACSCPVGVSPSGKPLTRRSSTSEPPSPGVRIFWSVKQRTSFGETASGQVGFLRKRALDQPVKLPKPPIFIGQSAAERHNGSFGETASAQVGFVRGNRASWDWLRSGKLRRARLASFGETAHREIGVG
jgi:hypothetical protein